MLHCPPLPGSPGAAGDCDVVMAAARERVLGDAATLVGPGSDPSGACGGTDARVGVDALMLENFGDVPFFAEGVPAGTVAAVAALAGAVREARPDVPLGINVLRNDAMAAMSVAAAVGAAFVRVNVLSAAMLTDQGVITGRAAELLRLRKTLGAGGVRILADVRVKHAAPLVDRLLDQEVFDLILRGGADGLIVSGEGTGEPTRPEEVEAVRTLCERLAARRGGAATPVYVGSGVNLETAVALGEAVGPGGGLIVGTHFKQDGRVNEPVDGERVAAFMARLSERFS